MKTIKKILYIVDVILNTETKLTKTQLFSIWQTKLQHKVAGYILLTTIDERSIRHKAANQQFTVNS